MTTAAQAIVDVFASGPLTWPQFVRAYERANAAGGPVFSNRAYDALRSRGLLLERERTVECSMCDTGGRLRLPGDPDEISPLTRRCETCQGTGSVKERVIGRPCRAGCEEGVMALLEVGVGDVLEPCSLCASTPTPGLDPGFQVSPDSSKDLEVEAPQLAPREER